MPLKAAVATLGCKVNQYETAQIQEELERLGYELVGFDCPADLYVVNTCAVTGRSGYQSRQLIRRAAALNPQAIIVVTGCYAQVGHSELSQIPGVDLILGQSEKSRLGEYLAGLGKCASPKVVLTQSPRQIELARTIHRFPDHSRAFIKIQDGCNSCCSYCIVPQARGRSRSLAVDTALEQARQLISAGYAELVLTGIHIGAYGRDMEPPVSLAWLVAKILALPGLGRLRLSSVEPGEFTPELIDSLSDAKICPHLHIPLQSGDDDILRAMRRPYTARDYVELVEGLCKKIPALAVGADVMVGFPGESDGMFRHTVELIKGSGLAYLHVFRYSPRPGTVAASMKPQVSGQVKLERSRILRAVGQANWEKFRQKFIGQTRPAIMLRQTEDGSGQWEGLTDNYIKVLVAPGPGIKAQSILPVMITL